jgi:branched-chain amino acid transport system substrate-binding protein
MKKSRWLLALLLTLSLVAAACGEDEGGGGGGGEGEALEKIPVTLYGQGAWSGPYSYLVTPSFQGAQMRIDELNADENFPAEITLEEADTQGDPANAPPVVEKATTDPNTVAIIGPNFSGESAASGDTYEEAGIPFITPSATATSLAEEGWTYWWRACGNDAGQGGLAGEFIVSEKPSSLFVAHDKSDYGQPLAETVAETAEKGGIDVADIQGVEAGAEDYSSLISAIEDSGADYFFFGGYDADFGKIAKQARDSGLDIPFMSGDGSLSSTFLDLAGAGAEGVTLIAPTNISGDFVDKYNEEAGGEASSVPVYAAEGYDVASLIGEGITQAREDGAETPEDIRAGIQSYMESLIDGETYEGEAKTYAYDDKHELAAGDIADLFYLYEATPDGIEPLGSAAEVIGG